MNFADTNWLSAIYIQPTPQEKEALTRREVVGRFMRRYGDRLIISPVVLLEARNIFSRITREREPREWQMLESDFDGRIYVDPMKWDALRRECNLLFSKYAWKADIGSFDTAIIASAKLAGGSVFLSFDTTARAMAAAEGMDVFPVLGAPDKQLVSRLKR